MTTLSHSNSHNHISRIETMLEEVWFTIQGHVLSIIRRHGNLMVFMNTYGDAFEYDNDDLYSEQ